MFDTNVSCKTKFQLKENLISIFSILKFLEMNTKEIDIP